jgi:hypothetical protein
MPWPAEKVWFERGHRGYMAAVESIFISMEQSDE